MLIVGVAGICAPCSNLENNIGLEASGDAVFPESKICLSICRALSLDVGLAKALVYEKDDRDRIIWKEGEDWHRRQAEGVGTPNGHINRVLILSVLTVASVNCRKEDQKRWTESLEGWATCAVMNVPKSAIRSLAFMVLTLIFSAAKKDDRAIFLACDLLS